MESRRAELDSTMFEVLLANEEGRSGDDESEVEAQIEKRVKEPSVHYGVGCLLRNVAASMLYRTWSSRPGLF